MDFFLNHNICIYTYLKTNLFYFYIIYIVFGFKFISANDLIIFALSHYTVFHQYKDYEYSIKSYIWIF